MTSTLLETWHWIWENGAHLCDCGCIICLVSASKAKKLKPNAVMSKGNGQVKLLCDQNYQQNVNDCESK